MRPAAALRAEPTWRPPVEPGGYWIDGPYDLPTGEVAASGPLVGVSLAIKDNIAVVGRVVGNGNPTAAAGAAVAAATAPAVAALLAAGARVRGRVVADEFAYSLVGVNARLGTPRNARWPEAVPGGSSSGSAAAVADSAVTLGVGTDTGGSIRVPAAYCGLVGFRPTHGRISTAGVTPLSPSLDTVGLLARPADVGVLVAAARCALGAQRDSAGADVGGIVVARDLCALGMSEVGEAVVRAATRIARDVGVPLRTADVLPCPVDEIVRAFSAIQGFEAWRELGHLVGPLDANPLDLAPDVLERFRRAAAVTGEDVAAADRVGTAVRAALDAATADGWLLAQPAAGVPPRRDAPAGALAAARRESLSLTAAAGFAAAPVVVLPASDAAEPPLGVALVGARGQDEALLAAVRRLGEVSP